VADPGGRLRAKADISHVDKESRAWQTGGVAEVQRAYVNPAGLSPAQEIDSLFRSSDSEQAGEVAAGATWDNGQGDWPKWMAVLIEDPIHHLVQRSVTTNDEEFPYSVLD